MSNYKTITTRDGYINPTQEIAKLTNENINDAIYLDTEKNIVLGLINCGKNLPILNYLMQNNDFSTYFYNLQKSYVIDYKNLKSLPRNIANIIIKGVKYFKDYGGYLNDKGEHVISLMSPKIGPHFAVNLLLGDRSSLSEPLLTTPKSVVDQFGGGSFRGPAANQVLATKWGMSPEENGSPYNRQFYILENGKQIFYSHDISKNVVKAICVHKVNQTEITYKTKDGLEIKRIIYIKRQHSEDEPIALERQVVEIKNTSNKDRKLKVVFVGMFGSANPGCQMVDVIYQTVINQTGIIERDNKKVAIMPDYYPQYAREYIRFFALDENGFDNFSNDEMQFIGNGNINNPENIAYLGNEWRVKGPSFFAVDKTIGLKQGECKVIVTSTGLVPNKNDLNVAIEKTLKCNYVDELEEIEREFTKYASFLQVKTRNKQFNNYVNRNLPFQVLYQTFVSRGFAQTQKGYREIGFREIQDIYASMLYFINNGQQSLVKDMLSKWINNVYEFGYANHNFFFVGKEPGMCSDDQIWLIEAIYRYVTISKDYEFLDESFLMAGSTEKRTLWDTLKAIITYSAKISVGKHNIPLLDKADWNDCLKIDDDCLNGIEKEKLYKEQLEKNNQKFGVPLENELSESVMNGFLLVIALKEMIALAKERNDVSYVKELKVLLNRLETSLNDNAYINGYYVRVLINRKDSKYKYLGTIGDGLSIDKNVDGSLYLNSLSWSILSGVASEDKIKSMLSLADKYLKTKAGYKLCTPHDLTLCGSKEAATEQYFLGDRENGGVFKHATTMFTRALLLGSKKVKDKELKKTMLDDVNYMLDIVYPFNVYQDLYTIKGNPRFCTQYVNSVTNEHIGPILSGTSTWLLLTLLESKLIRL